MEPGESCTRSREKLQKFRKDLPPTEVEGATPYAKRVKAKATHLGQQQLTGNWNDKALHGEVPLRTEEDDVDRDKTHWWLRSTGLNEETEDLIIADQN